MELMFTEAVALLTALGFKGTKKYDQAKVQVKINSLGDPKFEEVVLEDDAMNDILDDVLEALENGGVTVLEPDMSEPKTKKEKTVSTKTKKTKSSKSKTEKTKTKKTKAEPKAKAKAKAKAEPKAKKEPMGKDAFGSRLGTKAADLNAALTTSPKTMQALMADAGIEKTMYNHMNKLVEAGLVVKSTEGYALPGGAKKTTKKNKNKKTKASK